MDRIHAILGMTLLIAVCAFSDGEQRVTRTIVDMAGRTVTIPAAVNSVYSTSPMGEIFMYTLSPSKITGRTWPLGGEDKKFLLDEYLEKPLLGGWYGKNATANPEVIIKARPDIVLSMGPEMIDTKRIIEKIGIPIVKIGWEFSALDSSYRFLGRIIGEEARADSLARYCRAVLDTVRNVAKRIPEDRRTRVYYAEGLNGLETDPKGSWHAEVLEIVGGINVADVPVLQGYGRATVSFEQLLVWKPQMILVCPDHGHPGGTGHYANILGNASWRALDAVKNGNVYEIPAIPFNCFDRPPSVNRVLGLVWLSNLLYPDYFKTDIRAEVRKFYALFYHTKLTDEELDKVLAHAVRSKAPRGLMKGR